MFPLILAFPKYLAKTQDRGSKIVAFWQYDVIKRHETSQRFVTDAKEEHFCAYSSSSKCQKVRSR